MESEQELVLKQENLLREEPILSPKKEVEFRTKIAALEEKIDAQQEEMNNLKQQNELLRKALYGQKSEKSEVVLENAEQLTLFDEAEAEAEIDVKNAEAGIEVAAHKRKSKRTHEELFENLPVEEVVHEAEDRNCPECGKEMEPVGKEFVRDELVYVPAKLFVRKHYAEVLKCLSCGTDESKDALLPDVEKQVICKAGVPAPMIPHSFCSAELLAHILYNKYVQAVPLNRQEKEFKALGIELSRTTMANWVIYAAKKWAMPVYEAMKAQLLKESVIHADETVVQVLHEPGKKAKTDSRMWVYAAPKVTEHSKILFQYAPTRNGDNAVRFLGDYKGYLVCDGYDGYNKLTNVTRCGCFAHVRRKFVEALPTDETLLSTSKAAEGVCWCNKLFTLEQEYDKLSPEEKHIQRQERTKPLLDGFFAWLETVNASSGSKLAKAVQYVRNEKKYLYSFLENPAVPIDNNRAENAIRPFVVGRKNWLFSDSVKGAEASAMFYSLAATAVANGLNVEAYFTTLLSSTKNVLPWL